jgi:hypothetical protein
VVDVIGDLDQRRLPARVSCRVADPDHPGLSSPARVGSSLRLGRNPSHGTAVTRARTKAAMHTPPLAASAESISSGTLRR